MDVSVSEGASIGDGPQDKPLRQEALRLLTLIPDLVQAIRQAHAQDVFRVVMSSENAHLFKQGADGLYKPFLHNGGKFVENVNLAKVAPDYSKFTANLSSQVQMAAIMAKLDRIEQLVERGMRDNQNARQNNVYGCIDALNVAKNLSSASERRSQMLSACMTAIVALKVLAGQLRSNIKAMPSEKSRLFEGIFSDKLEDARRAFNAVTADMAAMAAGCKAVLNAYDELGERVAATVAFSLFLQDIEASGLDIAAQKARLVPGTKGLSAPESLVTLFKAATEDLHGHLISDGRSKEPLTIRMDLQPGDLEMQP